MKDEKIIESKLRKFIEERIERTNEMIKLYQNENLFFLELLDELKFFEKILK